MPVRVVIPDSHGAYISDPASRAFLEDLKYLSPDEIVMLGDHVDCSGMFNNHPRGYLDEMLYSYEEDVARAAWFLDEIQKRSPKASRNGHIHYIEGNHEQHVERWIVRQTLMHPRDAEKLREVYAPDRQLGLAKRGIKYYRSSGFYNGLPYRGIIKIGKCLFLHGFRANKYATASHLDDVGYNLVHGHTHRAQSVVKRTIHGEIGAWCPGTLSEIQPLWQHTAPNGWSHGYGLQIVESDGLFFHMNVPIVKGRSMLQPLLKQFRPR